MVISKGATPTYRPTEQPEPSIGIRVNLGINGWKQPLLPKTRT